MKAILTLALICAVAISVGRADEKGASIVFDNHPEVGIPAEAMACREGRLLIWNTESCIRNATGQWLFVGTFDHYHAAHPKGSREIAKPAQEPAPAKVPNPMASFARMVPGEWRVTFPSGMSMFHAWHWGPGKHSIRRMTDGSGAGGEPWRELEVVYWRPGLKQVRLLGISPYASGVSEGTIKFERETADSVFDLYQSGGRRKMGLRWNFDGPDKYHATLLEATGPEGLKPITEWDFVRSKPPAVPRPRTVDAAKPSKHLKVFESLLGHTWEAKGAWAAGDALHVHSTFERVPLAEVIYARVLAPGKDGEPTHLLDAYFYHHTGTDELRCLALSSGGGVFEGDLTVLDGGALQIDLKGYEGDWVVPRVVRLDFEKDGTLRHRVWSLNGAERTPVLDVHHRRLEPKND